MQTISSKTDSQKKELRTCESAQFWIQNADYIDAVKLFNTAEKKSHSDYNLHLFAVGKNDGLICSNWSNTLHQKYKNSLISYVVSSWSRATN